MSRGQPRRTCQEKRRGSRSSVRLASFVALSALAGLTASAAAAGPATVDVVNASRSTACAEEDNLYLKFAGDGIASFRIEATLPAYIDRIATDCTAPDFTACNMQGDPVFRFAPRSLTLFEDGESRLVGHTFERFWRPNVVTVRVAGVATDGLHLLQLFHRHADRWIEFLVLYPADGYWRVKPLPPAHLADTAYGSSFLIGPIEETGRPVVELSRIDFDPVDRRFDLAFAGGGNGSLQVEEVGVGQAALHIRLGPPVGSGRPFAALRSMFVAPQVADASEVAWQGTAAAAWTTESILAFGEANVGAVRFGRSAVSRHNTSAPDLTFGDFSRR